MVNLLDAPRVEPKDKIALLTFLGFFVWVGVTLVDWRNWTVGAFLHSANYYVVYPGNTPANHPPTEACMIHSKQHRGCRIQDPGTRGYRWWKTADFPHRAGTAHGAPLGVTKHQIIQNPLDEMDCSGAPASTTGTVWNFLSRGHTTLRFERCSPGIPCGWTMHFHNIRHAYGMPAQIEKMAKRRVHCRGGFQGGGGTSQACRVDFLMMVGGLLGVGLGQRPAMLLFS